MVEEIVIEVVVVTIEEGATRSSLKVWEPQAPENAAAAVHRLIWLETVRFETSNDAVRGTDPTSRQL